MGTNPCMLIISSFVCKLHELTVTISVSLANYSLVIIGIDRLYAALMFRTYEKSKNIFTTNFTDHSTLDGRALHATDTTVSMKANFTLMPICSNLLNLTPSTVKTVVIVSVANEILAVTVHQFDLRINTLKLTMVYLKNQGNLSARFQLDQNFKTVCTALSIILLMVPTREGLTGL